MKEALLQYVWQFKMFNASNLKTTEGEPLEIIDYGQKNENAGPDFFNAKIRIGDTIWAGNVEMHIQASDWARHGHDMDKRYDSVILHVVIDNDRCATRQNGEVIPTLKLSINNEIEKQIMLLESEKSPILKCGAYWRKIPDDYLKIYFSQMLNERLCQKAKLITNELDKTNGDWEEILYRAIARSLGMGVNAMPFEQLAKALPLKYIYKQRDNLLQTEAMLLGQAGLLSEEMKDEYYLTLQREYLFLKKKFGLTPIDASLWRFAKMRPVNFPHIRIVELAALLHKTEHLFSKIMEARSSEQLHSLLTAEASYYWKEHYTFHEHSPRSTKKLGQTSIDLIIINAIVPLLFAYAQKREDYELQDRAVEILEDTKPEKNHIISIWNDMGITVHSAYETQAILEIKKCYCDRNDCLRCGIAHKILCKAAKQY